MLAAIILYICNLLLIRFFLLPLLEIWYNGKTDTNILQFHKFPSNNNIVIFHTAVGEELMFRIFPHLILGDNQPGIRMFISMVLFPLMHTLPLIKRQTNKVITDIILTTINAFCMSLFLSTVEWNFSSPLLWYILCCLVHAGNNLLYFYNVNKNIVYNEGNSNGFVLKLDPISKNNRMHYMM